jgi:TPR repeat protein
MSISQKAIVDFLNSNNDFRCVNKSQLKSLIELLVNQLSKGDYTALRNLEYLVKYNQDVARKILIKHQKKALETIQSFDMGNKLTPPKAYELSLVLLGAINRRKLIDDASDAKAIDYLKQSMEMGNSFAMSELGEMYKAGDGLPRDSKKSIKLQELAVQLNCSYAMNRLANLYSTGNTKFKNIGMAVYHHEQAIKLGSSNSMSNLALMYILGKYAPKNITAAVNLNKKAIKLGNINSFNNIAVLCENGEGGPIDIVKAVKYYTNGVILGNPYCMSNLARLYSMGKGVTKNMAVAIMLGEHSIQILADEVTKKNSRILYKENKIKKSDAQTLLPLIWNDLIQGKSFTQNTLSLLQEHCLPIIIKKLTDNQSKEGTSIKLLNSIVKNKAHPLHQILQKNGDMFSSITRAFFNSDEFEILKKHLTNIIIARKTIGRGLHQPGSNLSPFFSDSNKSIWNKDIYNKIMDDSHPGRGWDTSDKDVRELQTEKSNQLVFSLDM